MKKSHPSFLGNAIWRYHATFVGLSLAKASLARSSFSHCIQLLTSFLLLHSFSSASVSSANFYIAKTMHEFKGFLEDKPVLHVMSDTMHVWVDFFKVMTISLAKKKNLRATFVTHSLGKASLALIHKHLLCQFALKLSYKIPLSRVMRAKPSESFIRNL